MFVNFFATTVATYVADKDGFSDWRDNIIIVNHEQSATHRDSMLTYIFYL